MTRESKLALILSFVLILVVGVLVSDHFSQVNTMDPDLMNPDSRDPIAQLPGASQARIDQAISRVMPESGSQSNPQSIIQNTPPVVIANGSNRNRSAGNSSLLDELSNGFSTGVKEFQAPALASPSNTQTRTTQQNPAPSTRQLGDTGARAYTVQEGDSLYQIASDELGDGNRWREIQALNSDQVGTDGTIRPGMKLKIPGKARVSIPQQVVSSEPRPAQTSSRTRSTGSNATTHTVVSGDVLGNIAIKYLGTSKRMDEIVKLNGLKDANDIRIGMTLKIPSK
ncbi:MAG: LysM peptidoglycan-binding domain-containing protein [Phycisphaerales bacterium]